MILSRRRIWRQELVAWAERVRDEPYVWGRTDCGTLAGQALYIQFGVNIFPSLFKWKSPFGAGRAWKKLQGHVGLARLCESVGGRSIVGRKYHWPMGTILVLNEDNDKWPAFGVSVPPFVVQSATECGVKWCEPSSVVSLLEAAWLFEVVNVEDAA